jgi:hypothetical protein
MDNPVNNVLLFLNTLAVLGAFGLALRMWRRSH